MAMKDSSSAAEEAMGWVILLAISIPVLAASAGLAVRLFMWAAP